MVCDPVVTDRNSSSLAWPQHSIVRLLYHTNMLNPYTSVEILCAKQHVAGKGKITDNSNTFSALTD